MPVELGLFLVPAANMFLSTLGLWQRLAGIMGIPMGQESLVELIESVRMVRDRQQQRITDLDARVRELEDSVPHGRL
jgi:hypothetical protein